MTFTTPSISLHSPTNNTLCPLLNQTPPMHSKPHQLQVTMGMEMKALTTKKIAVGNVNACRRLRRLEAKPLKSLSRMHLQRIRHRSFRRLPHLVVPQRPRLE